MISITYFPLISAEAQLIDLLSRAAWYLTFCPVDRIYVPIASEHLGQIQWRVADGMDKSIAKNFDKLRNKLFFVLAHKESDLQACMSEARIILRWKKDSCPGFVSAATLGSWLKGKKVWDVDPAAVRMEGSHYIEAGLHLTENKPTLSKENQVKFCRLAKKLRRFERAFLMATGPSISQYHKYNSQDSLNIVCNTVILDEELMSIVNPQILVFADPIFHFGPSQYAGTFRKSLIESARRYGFMICTPFKYYGLFVSAVPELADRTIGIPSAKNREFNFTLDKDFNLRTTANILTYLMIPLAGTFAKEIGFLGCDGRPLDHNNYFWGHNENTQINDKMANIREVHPGFFSIDYNDYYLEHCRTLEAQIQSGERQGLTFYSLAFSHIPALKSRLRRVWHLHSVTPDTKPQRVIIVDPDGMDHWGHYMAYNKRLGDALTACGVKPVVLCSREISPEILKENACFLPKISFNSWFLGTAESKADPEPYREEMLAALDGVLVDEQPSILYMYTGSIEYAAIFAEATRRHPMLYVNVNLFYLSFRELSSDAAFVEHWRPFMEWMDFVGPRFIASVPTRELQQEVAQAFGIILDVAPHPSTGIPDSMLTSVGVHISRSSNRSVSVLFPGGVRSEKGYRASIECMRLLGSDTGIRTILRYVPNTYSPSELQVSPAELPQNARVVDGVLSDDAFMRLFAEADLVVLPYSAEAFKNRTSGLLIDAMACGLPAVVVDGTWLANHVRQYDCGIVVGDDSAEALMAGVRQLTTDIAEWQEKTRLAAKRYFELNSWSCLAKFLLRPFSAPWRLPRVAGIDLTPVGGMSATGRIKEVFFRSWPKEALHWVNYDGPRKQLCSTNADGSFCQRGGSEEKLLQDLHRFDPDVIYYRPVENALVHSFATKAISSCKKPYVIHLMDDWPRRLAATAPDKFAGIDDSLRDLIAHASACLSIGESMSSAFGRRYGASFSAFANGIDPAAFPPRRRVPRNGDGFVICYAGGLAEDMNFTSIADVASAVESLPHELNVRFHIHTRSPWTDVAITAFGGMQSVLVKEQVAASDYSLLLQESDALLIAYNFDRRSRDYIGYSIANKMPECMASGTPILAYGPGDVATIAYLKSRQIALVVDQPGMSGVSEAIQELVASRSKQLEMGQRAREVAFRRHNLWSIAGRFRNLLNNCMIPGKLIVENPSVLVGPYGRTSQAHWNETEGVALLFGGYLNGATMVNVGGHDGSALMPFLNKDWKIFSFESRQDTGNKGLSAFQASYVEDRRSDAVSLREFFEHRLEQAVDFMKTDAGGHDLFVLQRFPWNGTTPAVIECKFDDAETIPLGYTFHDLAWFLVDKGYTVYVSEWHPVIRNDVQHHWNRLVRYPCELAEEEGWGKMLAFRDPVDEEELVAVVCKVLKVGSGQPAPAAAAAPAEASGSAVLPDHGKSGEVPPQCGRSTFKVVPDTHFIELSANQWRYTHSDARPKLWLAVFDAVGSTAGRDFLARIRLKSNRAMTVDVSIGRYGRSEYEGANQRVSLVPGIAQRVRLRKEFAKAHDAIKVQVDVLELDGGGTADMTIDSVSVKETSPLVKYLCDLSCPKDRGDLLALCDSIDEKELVAAVCNVLKAKSGQTAQTATMSSAQASGVTLLPVDNKPAAVPTQLGECAFKVVTDKHFIELSANQWRYTHSDAKQKLWQAVFDTEGLTAGRDFVANLHLLSTRAMTVDVSIGRYGRSEYEGANHLVSLVPRVAQSVRMRKEFSKAHEAIKVQVDVLQLDGGGTADITIDFVPVSVSENCKRKSPIYRFLRYCLFSLFNCKRQPIK